jgi:hypothetical protein
MSIWRNRHDAAIGQPDADDTAADRKQQALGQQLTNDPRSSRAHCEAECQLSRTRRRAAGQQARDVETGDEQHCE